MDGTNQTYIHGFILLGLSDVPYLQAIFFFLFLAMYLVTLSANMLLIVVVRLNTRLQTPMYFFLSNLAFIDMCFSSTVVPQIMVNTISPGRVMTVLACAAQMFISLVLGTNECMILAIMAFDRFAAICKPLHYNIIMNKRLCIILTAGSWTACLINSTIQVNLTFQLPFCRSHRVNHFFCEVQPFMRMSCKDTWVNEVSIYTSAMFIGMCTFIFVVMSYVRIFFTLLKIRFTQGRHKAFSTCTSHLIVVFLYYGTTLSIYLRPPSIYFPETDKVASLVYTTVTPMFNPIIYSVRNTDVIYTVKKIFNEKSATGSLLYAGGPKDWELNLCMIKKKKY